MKCPHCDVDLVMSERVGIEIDYCPKCRGVWLDRGELDKIIERSGVPASSASPVPAAAGVAAPDLRGEPVPFGYRGEQGHHGEHGHDGHDGRHSEHGLRDGHGHHQGKKSIWREIFD